MSGLRTRRHPTGRRAMIIAVLLSLLLPGLGHAYAMRFLRALIWFGGTIVIGLVLGGGEENRNLALAMGAVIAVLRRGGRRPAHVARVPPRRRAEARMIPRRSLDSAR